MKLRVALVTELYPPSVGGQQTRFEQLAHALAAAGDDVTVICTRNVTSAPPSESSENLTVRRGPLLPRYEWMSAKKLQRSPLGVLRFALTVRRELRAGSFDVAYFNQWPYVHVLLAPRAIRGRSGIDWCEYRSGLIHRVFQWTLPRLVSFNATVNEWTGAQIEPIAGRPLAYLPSGVDVAHYDHRPSTKRSGLLFLGRLVENKNLPLLIDGYEELRRRGLGEPLYIVGDGPERSVLDARVARLSDADHELVHVEGQVDEARKLDLLASSRALLLPSQREGFPNVVAEAIASGLPVATVSSPLNGAAQVVDRYGIGIVGEPTGSGFAAAVEQTLARQAELSARCLEVSDELDWAVLSQELHEMLERSLETAPRGSADA